MPFDREELRDFHFSASFEIPFVLLRYARHIDRVYDQLLSVPPAGQPPPGQRETEWDAELRAERHMAATASALQHDFIEVTQRATAQPKTQMEMGDRGVAFVASDISPVEVYESRLPAGDASRTSRKTVAMQKYIPYNSLIDSSHIVPLEEEWMYRYPSFLLRDKYIDEAEVEQQLDILLTEGVDGSDPGATVLVRAAHAYREKKSIEAGFSFADSVSVHMVDAPKLKRVGKRAQRFEVRDNREQFSSNHDLWAALRRPRKAKLAKKRFLLLNVANPETALVCYVTSPEEERPAMFEFFERHARGEKAFSDHTSIRLNTWETEFHISFYQLVDQSTDVADRDEDEDDEKKVEKKLEEVLSARPGKPAKVIVKASIGFRFFGDFFDRNWTCHVIEHIPAGPFRKLEDFNYGHIRPGGSERHWSSC